MNRRESPSSTNAPELSSLAMKTHPYRSAPPADESADAEGSRRMFAAEWFFASAFWLTSVACAASICLGGKFGAEGTIAFGIVIGFPILFYRLHPRRGGAL